MATGHSSGTDKAKQGVTIHDVARAAGVSVSTVSRVLNDRDDVSARTYTHVRQVIDELGYTSSLAARSMRSRKTNVIGVLVPDIHEPFSVEVIRGASRAASEAGYDMIAYMSARRPAKALGDWEQQQISLLNGSVVDGMIVITPHAESFRTAHPLVAIDPNNEKTDYASVMSTNHAGVLTAMAHLIGLGHRRIGYIGGRTDLHSGRRRFQAYQTALAGQGIDVCTELVQEGNYSRQSGYSGGMALFKLPCRPTAILAANDDSAIGVLDAARECGIRVPEELSVMGFDNVPEAATARPPLTTIDQSIGKMSRLATEILIQLIAGQTPQELVVKVETELVVRGSTGVVNG